MNCNNYNKDQVFLHFYLDNGTCGEYKKWGNSKCFILDTVF